MPRVRPTESSWDSDDDLIDDISGIGAFPDLKKSDTEEDELDEDALLGMIDDQLESTADQGQELDSHQQEEEDHLLDDETDVPLEDEFSTNQEEAEVANEESDDELGDVIDISVDADIDDTLYEETQDITEEVQGYTEPEQPSVEEVEYPRHEHIVIEPEPEPQIETDEPQKASYTEAEITQEESKRDDDEDEESEEEDEDDDESRGGRFKTERSSHVKVGGAKDRTDIPDTLEISQEDQAKIDEFLSHGNKGNRNRNQRGRRGNFGQNRNPNMPQRFRAERFPFRPSHSNAQPPMQAPSTQTQFPGPRPTHSSQATGMQNAAAALQASANMIGNRPRKILINPHFKGTVQTRPDVRLMYQAVNQAQQVQQQNYQQQSQHLANMSQMNRPLFTSPTTAPVQSYPGMQPHAQRMTNVQRPLQQSNMQPQGMFQQPPRQQPMQAWGGAPANERMAPPQSMSQAMPLGAQAPLHSHGQRPMGQMHGQQVQHQNLQQIQQQRAPLQQGQHLVQQGPSNFPQRHPHMGQQQMGPPQGQQMGLPQGQQMGPPQGQQMGPPQGQQMRPHQGQQMRPHQGQQGGPHQGQQGGPHHGQQMMPNQQFRGQGPMTHQPQMQNPQHFQGQHIQVSPGQFQRPQHFNQQSPSGQFQPRHPNQQFQQRGPNQQQWRNRQNAPQRYQNPMEMEAQPIRSLVQGQVQQVSTPRHTQPVRQSQPRFSQPRQQFHPRQAGGQQRQRYPQQTQGGQNWRGANPRQPSPGTGKKRKQSLGAGDMPGNHLKQPKKQPSQESRVQPQGKPLDPEALELQQRLEAQKRLREEVQKRKELRRQLMSGKGRQELERKLAMTGKTVEDLAPAPPGQVLATVQAIATQKKNEATQQSMKAKFSIKKKGQGQPGQGQGQKVQGQGQMPRNKLSVKQRLGQRMAGGGNVPGRNIPGQGSAPAKLVIQKSSNLKTIQLQDNVDYSNSNNNNINTNVRHVVSPGTAQNRQSFPNANRTVIPAHGQRKQVSNTQNAAQRHVVKPMGNTQQQHKKAMKRTIGVQQSTMGDNTSAPTRKVIVGGDSVNRVVKPVGSGRVRIDNLAKTTSQRSIQSLCEACGPLDSLNVQQTEGTALVKFVSPAHAVKFMKRYNQRMIELSKVNVALLPE